MANCDGAHIFNAVPITPYYCINLAKSIAFLAAFDVPAAVYGLTTKYASQIKHALSNAILITDKS